MLRRWAILTAFQLQVVSWGGGSRRCSAFQLLCDRTRLRRARRTTAFFLSSTISTQEDSSSNSNSSNGAASAGVSSTTVTKSSSSNTETKLRRGLAQMQIAMTPEFFTGGSDTAEVLGPFYSKLCKGLTEVKPSSIGGSNGDDAGLGLFAKKNIKAYTIVSFYPAHALGVDHDMISSGDGSSPLFVTTPNNEAYFAKHSSFNSPYLHCTDQPIYQRPSLLLEDNGEDVSQQQQQQQLPSVFLDVNPQLPRVDNCWVSQMINDGATVQQQQQPGATTTEAAILEYYRQSAAAKNCIHIPFGPSPVLATLTTKKVKKGQELLTTYGATYWLGEQPQDDGDNNNNNNHPDVTITPAIQQAIQETANDLRLCLDRSRTVYANQIEALQAAFDAIQI